MNLHEYQAKEILKEYGVFIPPFGVAKSVEEAQELAMKLDLRKAVLKIQVHAGGRGKAGGVKFAKSQEEIATIAADLIGMKMINRQTGPEGVVAREVLISAPVSIEKEFYLGSVIDRERAEPILIASSEGGMEIEEIAQKFPDKILKMPFDLQGNLRPYQLLRLVKFMGWEGEIAKEGVKVAKGVVSCFSDVDASLLEINPLVQSSEGKIIALDAKLSVDDNALFRQKKIASYDDPSQVSPQEAAARKYDLAYIAMHGSIGCMVNGAGLAMATMDIIQLYGESPANFLDVGGGASKEKVAEGFRIILCDPKVRAILVNIFGGIMNCATLAEGVVYACKKEEIQIPIVVRMEGTNVEEGKRIFAQSHLKIQTADDLKQAAILAIEVIKRSN